MLTYSDIVIKSGSTFTLSILLEDGQGSAVDLSLFSFVGQMRSSYSSSVATEFTCTVADPLTGQVTIELTPIQTAALKAGRYVWDLVALLPSGDVTPIAEGQAEVTKSVTNYFNSANPEIVAKSLIIGKTITGMTTLDGKPASHYLDYNNFINTPTSILDFNILDGLNGEVLTANGNGTFSFKPLVMDADTFGGQPPSYYLNYNNMLDRPTSIFDLGVIDGAAGQFLMTNADGTVEFADVSSIIVNQGTFGGQAPSYYLDYNNLTNVPTTLNDFGIVDGSIGDVLTTDGSGNYFFAAAPAPTTLNGQPASYYLDYTNLMNPPVIPTSIFQLDVTDGLPGQVLSTDGSGVVTFITPTTDAITLNGQTASYYTDYNNLVNTPIIPTSVTQLGFTSNGSTGQYVKSNGDGTFSFGNLPTNALTLNGKTDSFFQNYNNLINTPVIPTSILDLGVTDGTIGQVMVTDGFGGFTFTDVTLDGKSGSYYTDYNNLVNTPIIPTSVFQLGMTDGLPGQVLTTDGSGNVFFIDEDPDAETLNGQLPSFYLDYTNFSNTPFIPLKFLDLLDMKDGNPGQVLTTNGNGQIVFADSTLGGQPASYYTDYNNLTNKPSIPSDVSELSDVNGLLGGGGGGAGVTALSLLTDVNIGGVADGQVLTWNTTSLKWIPSTITMNMSTLGDVITTGVANGQVLSYDGTTSKWIPTTPNDKFITGLNFGNTGILTITLNDSSTVETDLDGRYIQTVNGIVPDPTGNVAVSLTSVITGPLADIPASATEGTSYIVANDPDPTVDGKTFIYSTADAQWYEVAGFNQAAMDARYVNELVDGIGDLADVDMLSNPPVAGQTLIWNGTNWAPNDLVPPVALSELTDVDVITNPPVAGQTIGWTGVKWIPMPVATMLSGLGDVDVTTLPPVAGSELVFDGVKWVTATNTKEIKLPDSGQSFGRVHIYGNEVWGAGSNSLDRLHSFDGSGFGINYNQSMRFPALELPPTRWVKTAITIANFYGLGDDGKFYIMGDDLYGALGDGTSETDTWFIKKHPSALLNGPGITILDFWVKQNNRLADEKATAVYVHVNDNGVLKTYTWGTSWNGMLGINSQDNVRIPTIVPTFNGVSIKTIDIIDSVTMAVTTDGRVFGAGYSYHGNLGTGTGTSVANTLVFTQAMMAPGVPVTGAIDAATGWWEGSGVSGFILLADGRVLGAGSNINNALGRNTTTRNLPYFDYVKINATTPLTNIVEIYTGVEYLAALDANGGLWFTGSNHDYWWGNGEAGVNVVYATLKRSNVEKVWVPKAQRGWCNIVVKDKTDKLIYGSGVNQDYALGVISRTAGYIQTAQLIPLGDGEECIDAQRLGAVDASAAYLGMQYLTNKGNIYVTGVPGTNWTMVLPTLVNDYYDAANTTVVAGSASSAPLVGVLDDLTDVNLVTPPTAGQVLAYSGTQWVATTPVVPPSNLDGLTDVNLVTTAPTSGQVLAYNGTEWVPSSIATPTLASEYGEAIMPTAYSLSVAGPTVIVPFTLPSAGVWEVSYILDAYTGGSGQQDQFVFFIDDATGTILTGSECDMYITPEANVRTSTTQTVRITTTGPKTFQVKARRVFGLLQIDANRAKVIWKKISGLLPMSPTAQYHSATLNIALSGGGNVAQDMTSASQVNGTIPFAAGVWTLTAGVTYDLSTSLIYDAGGTNQFVGDTAVAFVDATTNAVLPNQTAAMVITPAFNARGIARNGVNRFTYTPSTNQTIKLRVAYQSNAGNLSAQAYISQIGSYSVTNTGATKLDDLTDVVIPTVVENGSRLQYNGTSWVPVKDASAVTGSAPLYFEAGLGDTQEALTGLGFTLSGEAALQQNIPGNFNSAGIRLIDTVGAGGNGTVGWNPLIDWTKNVRVSFRMFIPNALTVDDIIVGMAGNLDKTQSIEMSIDPYTGAYKVRKNGVNITTVPWASSPAGNPTGAWSRFVTEIITVNGKRILKLMRWTGGELQIAAAGDVTGFGTQFTGLYFYAWNGSAIPSNNVLLQSCQVEYI